MFKPARWWSEKNRIKVVFKLQFHASQVGDVGGDGLIISVVPGDTGKPSIKSDKAAVRDGSCLWENPIHETVKFIRDPKSGKIHQRIYHLLVGTGPSKSCVVGEASIDFSSYAEASKASLLSLPLKNSKSEALLHVSIQRVHESMDQREIEENENATLHSEVSSQLGNHDVDGEIRSSPIEEAPPSKAAPLERSLLVSSGSDTTLSSSGSSSGLETPWKMQIKNENNNEPIGYLSTPGPKSDTPSPEPHQKSWEWLRDPDLEEEGPDIVIDRLKKDASALSRQVDMSDLEQQALRKQVAKESKRGQDLWREVVLLKEERDGLKGECERLKSKSKSNLTFDGVESQVVEELRQELNHAKELNANLHIQLQKTQESNSELILAVRDLEEMVEQKNDEREVAIANDEDDDDEEQQALDDIVKEHPEIEDLQTEIEIYKREKDELEMQMEQLALDYEIMKQANHDMACKLEQSQIQEHLNMQYESSSSAEDHEIELGTRIKSLENELQTRTKEYEDSLVVITELQSHADSLEKEVEKQARGYEADVEALTRSKVEQEHKAIRAEETLKKMRWKNANAAERLQNEFRKLSVQMASTFEANEKLATNAMAEANELRLQKSHLEEMLRKISEENNSVEGHYVARLEEVSSQVTFMSSQIVQLESDIKEREVQMDDQKKQGEETRRLLCDEISVLKEEIEEHIAKNEIILEDLRSKEAMMNEVEKLKLSVKELELVVEKGNDEKIEAENRVIFMKESEVLAKELDRMRCLVRERELAAVNLQSELDSLRGQFSEVKHDEKEKEGLRKQVLQLRNDLKKKEDAIKSMEKKIRDGNGRAMNVGAVKGGSKTSTPSQRGSKEVANLKERIKLLKGEIKVKENALEKSANEFLEREEVLHRKIEELEDLCKAENPAAELKDQACKGRSSEEESNIDENSSTTTLSVNLSRKSNDATDEEVKNAMALLIERNKSMERDLKEMQERYSDMSLKFAEVEGERQQLVMKLRGLVNAKKSPHSTNLFAPVY